MVEPNSSAPRRMWAGGELEWRRADLSSLDEVRQLADSLLEEGRIDVLVNNAGISAGHAVEETSLAEFQAVMNT